MSLEKINLIKELLGNKENLWLEYKSKWYWSATDIEINKSWGEFLKDFSALFNTYSKGNYIKYFIIGFDEKDEKYNNYYEDSNRKKISIFDNITSFKKKVIEKIKNNFICSPDHWQGLTEIETLFDVSTVKVKEHEILVFTIFPAPYLLEVKGVLQGNESFREGNIIIRRIKPNSEPENSNASHDEVSYLKSVVAQEKTNKYPHKDTSIEKVVGLFKDRVLPTAEVLLPIKLHEYSTGIHFEIFTVEGEYLPTISFVYFSSYTSQNKTIKYINENKLLDKKNQIIVLTDERNRKGGIVDKARIEEIFSNSYSGVEVYYLEQFALEKLYQDLFDPEIFHQGSFNINDFIRPFTDASTEKTADTLLKEWYIKEKAPLLVLRGVGGIGKTTVAKYFLDTLSSETTKNVNILFINSHEIINDIMKNPKIEDIFDFYKIVAEKYNISKKFNKKLLELSVDNGNLVIALDGIDEVITKVGSKFNISRFIDSIFGNYSENMEKTKILITCRDYFWDKEELKHPIHTISLEPFTRDLANNYFEKHFVETNKVKHAIELADDFALKQDEQIYIPYILDMIKDHLLDSTTASRLNSSILMPGNYVNDYLVSKVCEREIKKLENSDIDKQIETLIFLAVEFNGIIHENNFSKLGRVIEKRFSDNKMDKFKAHPLLKYDLESKILSFRYDFFNEYFKQIKLYILLKNPDFKKITEDSVDIIIQYVGYDNNFYRNIGKRLSAQEYKKLKESVWDFVVDGIDEVSFLSSDKRCELNSSLFVIIMILEQPKDKTERTTLLKEFYEKDDGIITDLSLINVHTRGKEKPLFDFRNLTFKNCLFENYEYFSECLFNDSTWFTHCKFVAPLHRDGVSLNIKEGNIDKSTCSISGIIDIISEVERVLDEKDEEIRAALNKIFKFFWQGSTFNQKLSSETHKKFKAFTKILELLVKNKVIMKTTVTSKQKRADKAYYISKKFSNLRKIFEENSTCYEFEKIVKMFK